MAVGRRSQARWTLLTIQGVFAELAGPGVKAVLVEKASTVR